MEQMSGVVDSVENRGIAHGSGIVIKGIKYGVYDPASIGMDSLAVGTEVSFTFHDDGRYKNIKGKLTRGSTGNAVSASPASPPPPAYSKGYSRGAFPVPPLDGTRSIIRQNAVTNANKFHEVVGYDNTADSITELLETAARIEAYTSGDDVAAAAEALLKGETPQ